MNNIFIRDFHLYADDSELAQGCRMRLTVRESLSLLPQLFHLEVENLSESSMTAISSARRLEVCSAGSLLASGEVVSACPRFQSGRSFFSVTFSPGLSLWNSSVSLSLSAGMKVSDTILALLAASGTGIQLAAYAASDPVLSRPQSFFGRTVSALETLAGTAKAGVFLTPAGLCVMDLSPTARTDTTNQMAPTMILPEEAIPSAPVFLPDRVLLPVPVAGWTLGACLRFTWQGREEQGIVVSRLLQLDTVSGPWRSQVELIPA